MQAMAREEFLFTDENIFTIEEVFNQQIDRIYASTSRETHDKAPGSRETIILLQSWFCWGVSFDATTRLHFYEKGVKSSAKVYENTMLEPLWSFLTTLCSVMNIGALSRIWHLPAVQTLARSGSGGFSGLNYSGWFRVYWPFSSSDLSPMDSKSGQCLKAWSVRRGTPISKFWSAPWWKQWWIYQRRHCVIQ